MFKLYQYNDNDYRIVIPKTMRHGFGYISTKNKNTEPDKDEVLRCALSRSKRLIREISLSNDFTYFFTATVNSAFADRFSLTEVQNKIRKICKAIKRKNKGFKYIFITERHLNGAFHFHGLCTDLDLYDNEYNYLSSKDFDTLGFNSFSPILSKQKVSNYITKYISKDCVRNEAGSVYFCSRGLKHASVYNIEDIPLDDYLVQKPYENDYCKIYDFNLEKLNSQELLFLIDNLKTI